MLLLENLAIKLFPRQIHEYNQGKFSRLISLEEKLKSLKKNCRSKNFEEKIIAFIEETDFINDLKLNFLLVSIKDEYRSQFSEEFHKMRTVYLECMFEMTLDEQDTFEVNINKVIEQVHFVDKLVQKSQLKAHNETNI